MTELAALGVAVLALIRCWMLSAQLKELREGEWACSLLSLDRRLSTRETQIDEELTPRIAKLVRRIEALEQLAVKENPKL